MCGLLQPEIVESPAGRASSPCFPAVKKASQEVLLLEARNPRVCECVLALVFLLFLRSLFLGCHEVFPSVDVFPLQGFLISRGP